MKLSMISLGCAKNKIDTELFLGVCSKYNIEITDDLDNCDLICINTCGFIESAKKEAIDTILEMCDYKKNGTKIIAMGCLIERYYDEIQELLPEVDYFIPIKNYIEIDKVFKEITNSNDSYNFDYKNRILTTYPHSAYIRIAEGCNNRCSYCAIPLIRGNFTSRKKESILEEAKVLVDEGVSELTIIAQDTTRYGTDIYKDYDISDLLKDLEKLPFKWIRLLYLYPDEITDKLIYTMTHSEKIVPYFDIPLQHISNKMLSLMNRRGMKEDILVLLDKINQCKKSILRTTLMVGFPNEDDNDQKELLEFIEKYPFDRLGVFEYSDEDDTKGYEMEPKVPKKISHNRYKEVMRLQNKISKQLNKQYLNKEIEVVIDNYDFESGYYIARGWMFAPDDVDGCVYIKSDEPLILGNYYKAYILKITSYDLYGIILKK